MTCTETFVTLVSSNKKVIGVTVSVLDWSYVWSGSSSRFFQDWPGCCTGAISATMMAFASLDIVTACSTFRHLSMMWFTFGCCPMQVNHQLSHSCSWWPFVCIHTFAKMVTFCLCCPSSVISMIIASTEWNGNPWGARESRVSLALLIVVALSVPLHVSSRETEDACNSPLVQGVD